MIKIILAIIILIGFLKILNLNESIENIKQNTKEISIHRPVESLKLTKVKNDIIRKMKNIGLIVQEQPFTRIIKNKKYKMSNLISYNSNTTKPYIVLGAHIDSIQTITSKAAIDSATSVAIILELTNNILKHTPDYPIMVLFFDGEEAIDGKWNSNNSLSGSSFFVNNFNLKLIDKVYIFDLIGGDIKDNKICAFEDNLITYNDLVKLSDINKQLYQNDEQIFINPKIFTYPTGPQDDNLPFIEKGIYALNLIPYKFPNSHHKITDNYENVNWKYVEIFYNVLLKFLL